MSFFNEDNVKFAGTIELVNTATRNFTDETYAIIKQGTSNILGKIKLGSMAFENADDLLRSFDVVLPSNLFTYNTTVDDSTGFSATLNIQTKNNFFAAPDNLNGSPIFRGISRNDLIDTEVMFTDSPANTISLIMISQWNEAYNNMHTHTNYHLLESINQNMVDEWNLADENILEGIQLEGVDLPITLKKINLNYATPDEYGMVKIGGGITVVDGVISVTETIYSPGYGIAINNNTISHNEGNGWNHIPENGTEGQILSWESNGKAKWISGYATENWVSTNFMNVTHAANVITGTDISNWNTAFGWGNHSGLYALVGRSILAGNGLSGGGTLAANRTITLGTPSAIGLGTTNSVASTSHTHALDAATTTAINQGVTAHGWGDFRDYGLGITSTTTATTLTSTTIDDPTLPNGLYHIASAQNTGFSGSADVLVMRSGATGYTTQKMQVISSNNVVKMYLRHFRVGASTWSSWREVITDENLDSQATSLGFIKSSSLSGYVPTSRTITAGNGLSGGGNLTANRTITLGTPSAVTLASTNSVGTSSHTHAFTPGGTTAQYIRGDGSLATFPNINTNYISTDFLSGRGTSTSNLLNIGTDFYYITSSDTSRPSGSTDGALLHQSHSSSWFTQLYSDWRTNDWYVRVKNNGTVGSWAKLIHTGNFNPSDYALASDIPNISGLVPYTGATANVNLGGNRLYSWGVSTSAGSSHYSYNTQVSSSSPKPLLNIDKTNIGTSATGYAYIVRLSTSGTSTVSGRAIGVYYNANAWRLVRLSTTIGKSSNIATMEIVDGVPCIVTAHSSSYSISATVEAIKVNPSYSSTNIFGPNYDVMDERYAMSSDLSGYLPLSGGTMTGSINWTTINTGLSYNGVNRLRFSNTVTVLSSNVPQGSSYGIYFRPQGEGSSGGQIVIQGDGQINTSNHGNSSQWKQAYDWGDFRDYGLGIRADHNSDANNSRLWDNGFYTLGTTATNRPSYISSSYASGILTISETTARRVQIATGGDKTERLSFRSITDTTQGDWLEFIHDGNLDTQATSLGFIKSSALPSTPNLQQVLTAGNEASTSIKLTGSGATSNAFTHNYITNTSGGWARVSLISNITNSSTNEVTESFRIGAYGSGPSINYYHIGTGTYNSGTTFRWYPGDNTGIIRINSRRIPISVNGTFADASGNISVTDTTYSAGTGLSLSGTTFGQAITTSGSGTYVQSITQTTSGFQVNLGTPPNTNTTYSAGTLALLNTGTNTSNRVWSASILNDWLTAKGYLTSSTANYIAIGNGPQTGTSSGNGETLRNGSVWSTPTTGGIPSSNGAVVSFNPYSNGKYGFQLGARSNKFYGRTLENGTLNSWVEFIHAGNLSSNLSGYVQTSRTITAGNGLSGGGNLTANRTITLATPGAITLSSTNLVESSSHTHAFTPGGTTAQYIRGDGSLATIPTNHVTTARSITAGNGLTGGGSLASNRTITLGTPGDITLVSTSSVGTSSHTHAFNPGGTTSQYIRGDGSLATYANTTYSAGSLSLLTAGTNTTNRVWSARNLHNGIISLIDQHAEGILGVSVLGGIYTKDWSSTALGQHSIAIGYTSTVTASSSIAMGKGVFTGGAMSQNIGFSSNVNKSLSTNVGSYNLNTGELANTFGQGLINQGMGLTVIGKYNQNIDHQENMDSDLKTAAIQFGVGKDELTRRNAITIFNDRRAEYDHNRDDSSWTPRTIPDIEYVRDKIALSTSFVDVTGSGTRYINDNDIRDFAEIHIRVTTYSAVTIRLNSTSTLLKPGQKIIIYPQYDDQTASRVFHAGTGRNIQAVEFGGSGSDIYPYMQYATAYTFIVVNSTTLRLINRSNIS